MPGHMAILLLYYGGTEFCFRIKGCGRQESSVGMRRALGFVVKHLKVCKEFSQRDDPSPKVHHIQSYGTMLLYDKKTGRRIRKVTSFLSCHLTLTFEPLPRTLQQPLATFLHNLSSLNIQQTATHTSHPLPYFLKSVHFFLSPPNTFSLCIPNSHLEHAHLLF